MHKVKSFSIKIGFIDLIINIIKNKPLFQFLILWLIVPRFISNFLFSVKKKKNLLPVLSKKLKNNQQKGLLLKAFYLLPALLFYFPVHQLSSATVGTLLPLVDTSEATARVFSKLSINKRKNTFFLVEIQVVTGQVSTYMLR